METLVEKAKELVVKKVKFLKDIESLLLNLRKTQSQTHKIRSKCGKNQFLIEGLVGLRQAAVMKQNKNLAFCFKKAIKALQRYPFPILHPIQCLDLQGIGNSLLKSIYSIFKSNHKKYVFFKPENSAPKEPKKPTENLDFDKFEKILAELDQKTLLKDLVNVNYDITLLVDNRENRVKSFLPYLDKFGVKHEERKLGLGDFLWIVKLNYKDKEKKVHCEEYVLDFIIERKTSSDLTSSHTSNHLRDQIRRMKAENFPYIFLLIEGKGESEILLEVSLQHKIRVIQTNSHEQTAQMIAYFTREISLNVSQYSVEIIRHKKVFERFNGKHISTRPLISDVFKTQLADFPGMSARKVTFLLTLYSTFAALRDALKNKQKAAVKDLKWAGIGIKVINDLITFLGV